MSSKESLIIALVLKDLGVTATDADIAERVSLAKAFVEVLFEAQADRAQIAVNTADDLVHTKFS
jgi:hypothetical protein